MDSNSNWWAWMTFGIVIGMYLFQPRVRHAVNCSIVWIIQRFEALLKKTDGKDND